MTAPKPSFFAELQRRHVYKVGAMYAVAGWLLVQIVTQVFPIFDVSSLAQRVIVLVIVGGFPVTLILAWLFDVTAAGIVRTEALPADGQTPAQRHERRGTDRRLNYVLAALLVIGVGYFIAERTFLPGKPPTAADVTAPQTGDKSIAVLPFADLSPEHDQEYFSDGMAEELLDALAKVKDLKVTGRTSSFSFRGHNEDLRAVGKALAVANILEGSVRKQGNRVRITVQLIQTSDGFHRWSESYDGEMTDVFELQERIAHAVTAELKVVLQGDQQKRLVPVATNNPEAYALYLRATTIFNRRDGAHFADAISGLSEAIRLDPKFARAHSRLAALFAIGTNYTAIDAAEAFGNCEREARIAIELDPTLAEPHAALGQMNLYRRHYLAGREELQHALALDPQDVTANFWNGTTMIVQGYIAQGIASIDRALVIDPLLPNALSWRGHWYLNQGDWQTAKRMLQQSVDAGLSTGELHLATLAHIEGHDQDAAAYFARGARGFLVAGFPDDASAIIGQGIYGDAAARARAIGLIDAYLASKPRTISGGAPWALLLLGESARALQLAQDAPTTNDPPFLELLWSPASSAVRKLPQFPEFVRKAGLSELWDKYGAPDECRRHGQSDYVCE